ALKAQNKDAFCRIVLRTKPKLCLVGFSSGVMMLNTIHYASEVRSPEMLGTLPIYQVTAAELELAELLINKLTKPFNPEEYPDTYREAIGELVQRKLSGQEVHVAQKAPEPQVASILEALQKSLEKVEQNVPTNARH
ncbi:MAG: Ku protein, partial [Bacillota bacterium]